MEPGHPVSRFILHPSSFILLFAAQLALAQPVRITQKPDGLVHGIFYVSATVAENVVRVELYVNGVKWSEAHDGARCAQG